MKKLFLFITLGFLLLGISACKGDEKSTADYEVVSQTFIDALFAGKFEDAKAMAMEGYAEPVTEGVDAFAAIYEKYNFRQIEIASVRPWQGTAKNPEGDKRLSVTFQFSPKDTESWRTGTLDLRSLVDDAGLWGVAGLILTRPKQ